MIRFVAFAAMKTTSAGLVMVAPVALTLKPETLLAIKTKPVMSWARVRLVVDSCPIINDPLVLA